MQKKKHNCKIHGTTAKQIVQLQKNALWQFSFALTSYATLGATLDF
jgi:hypothetical protein